MMLDTTASFLHPRNKQPVAASVAALSFHVDSHRMARKKTGNPVGRPMAIDASTQEAIVERLISGEVLASICETAGMPSLSTVFRQMRRNPDFGSEIRRAREGFAEHLFQKILQAAEDMTPENAAEMAAKARIWQWAAARCAPRIYSERAAIPQIAAPVVAASNARIKHIDMKSMSTDELMEFRRLLAKAKTFASP